MTQIHTTNDASSDEAPPTFDLLPLSHEVRKAVDALGYTHPTPVQVAVFASVASGRDVVVQARTGTGKTAAFGLPVIDRLVDVERHKAQVLVLCPTRELALQIHRELELIGRFKKVSTTAIYGGAAMQPQIDAIAAGAQVIAGTPGRVLDHLERGTLKTKSITALVLDESDEMLSMGFLPQITKIMEYLPTEHQTLLFSATLPPDVKRIADSRLKDPEFITLSGDHIGALSIEHYVYRSSGRKAEELIQLIEIENPESAIIFCNTRDQTKHLATALQKKGFGADWLNADLSQKDREKVMAATREGKLRFLVCTDVAARGIDISHLTHVINADFPESTENYVHRTGRTGRAGRTGTAISLITPQDVGNLYMLRLTYKIFPVERDLPRPLELKTRKEADMVQFLEAAFPASRLGATDRSLARRVLSSDQAELIVAGLLADHLGAHPNTEASAGALRREALPAPIVSESESQKKKKKKKKKDKLRESKGDESEDESIPSPTEANENNGSTPAPPSEHTLHRQAVSGPAARMRVEAEQQAKEEAAADLKDINFDKLEVVSASDLLNAEEQAMLRGESFDSSAGDLRSPVPVPVPAPAPPSTAGRIFVSVGLRDKITKEDFLDTLADVGFPLMEVLEVEVRDAHSFVVVPKTLLNEAIECLNGEEVGGLEVRAEEARPPRRPDRGGRGRDESSGRREGFRNAEPSRSGERSRQSRRR